MHTLTVAALLVAPAEGEDGEPTVTGTAWPTTYAVEAEGLRYARGDADPEDVQGLCTPRDAALYEEQAPEWDLSTQTCERLASCQLSHVVEAQ